MHLAALRWWWSNAKACESYINQKSELESLFKKLKEPPPCAYCTSFIYLLTHITISHMQHANFYKRGVRDLRTKDVTNPVAKDSL